MNFFPIILLFLLMVGCSTQNGNPPEEHTPLWISLPGDDSKPHIVLISGDEEYRSEEALPQLGAILNKHHGFTCTVLFAQDPEQPGIVDPNYSSNIPGLEHLKTADLMIIFTRFRSLPDSQMQYIDDYLRAGKPVLGIRTSTHAFRFEEKDSLSSYQHYGNYYTEEDDWKGGFGRLVLGEKWISHHGRHGEQSTRGMIAPNASYHPILNGISEGDIWGPTDVYGVRLPFADDAEPLVLGLVIDRELAKDETDPLLGMRPTDNEPAEPEERNGKMTDPNNPMMPVGWTKTYQIPGGMQGRSLTSTIGASVDLLQEGTRRLLVNGVFWLTDLKVPEKAKVEIVGKYNPTRFAFYDDAFWEEKQVSISSISETLAP